MDNEQDVATDEALVERARESPDGDLRAFEQLVERHRTKIMANCRYLTRDPNHAEDLAQEVFVKVFFGLPRFEGRSSFRTWLQRIKVNHCLNHLKKGEGKEFVDVEDPAVAQSSELSTPATAERAAQARDERRRIAAVLDGMNDTLRVPLIMRDLDKMAYEEIASTLGIGLSAAKMRIKRGREEFRRQHRAAAEPASAHA